MRKLALLEPSLLFAYILLYIWVLRFSHPWLILPVVAWLALSHYWRRPHLEVRNFAQCVRQYGAVLAILAAILLAAALAMHAIRPIPASRATLALAAYLPWGLLQQYILNCYFLERFEQSLSPRLAAAVTSVLFALAHTPNYFLMAATLVGAWSAIHVYRRYRNLYFLGLAHAMIGFLLFMTVPDSISHHLNIGPGLKGSPTLTHGAGVIAHH